MGNAGMSGFPVDGHVHFHRLEQVAPTLDAAAANFTRVSGREAGLSGAILLVQTARERVFERLLETGAMGDWRFSAVAAEPQTVIAQSGPVSIAVVCGQQIRCERGLEVLALGTVKRYPEGRPLEETLDLVVGDGTLAAVPWGFGKWTGQRGELVRGLFRRRSPDAMFVGDNGGRVQALGMPALVRTASEAGFRVLPGTDPFPFGGDHRRVGAFGFLAATEPGMDQPWTGLRHWLESNAGSPAAYGRALGPVRFVFNQVWIQVYNRTLRKAAA